MSSTNHNSDNEQYGVASEELRFLNRLANQTTQARLEAGHHPEDILLNIWDLYDSTVRSLLDGCYPQNSSLTTADSAGELEAEQEKNVLLSYELQAQEDYIRQLEAACAPSKLAKIKRNR